MLQEAHLANLSRCLENEATLTFGASVETTPYFYIILVHPFGCFLLEVQSGLGVSMTI